MKKFTAILLILALALSFAACGKKGADTKKSEGVMTYAEYMAADLDTEVTIEAYVQATQSWWDNTITVYAMDADGGYFMYGMACSEADAAKLVPGTKIKVTGFKSEWAGEVEIVDGTFEFESGSFIAEPVDLTAVFGTDKLADYMNQCFAVKGAKVVAAGQDDSGNDVPFLYNWDGSGSHDGNSDLYFSVEIGGAVYSFTVESYLTDNTTDVYAAVEALEIGQTIDVQGFLYWYEGANPHITSVKVVG